MNESDFDPTSEMYSLVLAHLNGDASHPDMARLNELIASSEDGLDLYCQLVRDACDMREWAEAELERERIQANELSAGKRSTQLNGSISLAELPSVTRQDDAPMSLPIQPGPSTARHLPSLDLIQSFGGPRLRYAAAILVAISLAGLFLTSNNHLKSVRQSEATQANSVATVERISGDCKWVSSDDRLSEGAVLASGQEIRIEKGDVTVRFNRGARVTLLGPSRFTVKSPNSGALVVGCMRAFVPTSAYGFGLDLPNGKVVDLGTEFGVVVDDFGVSEVGVFNGKVMAHQQHGSSRRRPVELTKGNAIQWDETRSTRFDVALPRFGLNVVNPIFPSESAMSEAPELADDFDDESLDRDNWRTLGAVVEKQGSLQLGSNNGEIDRDNVPYLLTRREFDPAAGTILVTGKVSFSEPLHRFSGALSIFTRAVDRRGTFPRPSYAYLATGVRSTFWPVSTVRGQALRILVRPMGSGENVGLLGEEFASKGDTSKWAFALSDDGVNVSLTISKLNDPSVRKTVSCRSLFRGEANVIGIEGDPNGLILIDDLKIYQFAKTQ